MNSMERRIAPLDVGVSEHRSPRLADSNLRRAVSGRLRRSVRLNVHHVGLAHRAARCICIPFSCVANKQVKLAGKTLLAILARRVGRNAHLLAPVVACSLPATR